jgi:AcrR family transcriptional regulator
MFGDVGYQRSGLRAIAKEAGVNLALVSRYFGSKEGLYAEVMRTDLKRQARFPDSRAEYGANMAKVLTSGVDQGMRVGLSGLHSREGIAISVQALEDNLRKPLAEWIGPPSADERALKILMICSGFITHSQLLPLSGADSDAMTGWLGDMLQSIVDGDAGAAAPMVSKPRR